MVRFNLDEYDLVENRIAKFLEDYPDGRIITREMTTPEDRANRYWVVMAEIFTDHEDQHARCPKASGWAFEIEGTSGANATSALENCETSAIGRALANAGYSGKKRPSQEEMKKVARSENPVPADFMEKVSTAKDEAELKKLWEEGLANGWSEQIQKVFSARKKVVS